MDPNELGKEGEQALDLILGHLNFASGSPDAKVLAALNTVYRLLAERKGHHQDWFEAASLLQTRLADRHGTSSVFSDTTQAGHALDLTFNHVLPGYLQFHSDLLFHQKPEDLFNCFFVGRAFEAVLKQGAPWEETDRIVAGAIRHLNDFLGHRPLAALETQKTEPYPHEKVRPVPLYIHDVGAASGKYQAVVETALQILRETEASILHDAYFDLNALAELAYDPRAYDFDHPANKRPNYHFGQWDPHTIDQHGRYRRFVIQQVTLDSLMSRMSGDTGLSRGELLIEAGAVLAGTILMASGISGDGPEAHDSTVTLSTLLPRIARYRDAFYEKLLEKLPAPHGVRLQLEAKERRQPFGGARQHLNAQLARRRASQLEHVHIAQIYARMGFPQQAEREANVVPCASSRMLCRIDCLLSAVDLALERKNPAQAAEVLPIIVEGLRRAIECGATVDPWNILGCDAQFSLFPSAENSVRDHRVDELLGLMEQIFAAHSRVWSDAAAIDDQPLSKSVASQFKSLAQWWHKFAVHEVSSVEAINALDSYRAAEHVAQGLHLWHKGNTAAGDVKFWTPYAAMFDTPKAYALVIDALLERQDLIASQALLVHWLSRVEEIGLVKADVSFHALVQRWFAAASRRPESWKLTRRFLDYMEANAESYGSVPEFELSSRGNAPTDDDLIDEDFDDEEPGETFNAAYEDMVFRDSTDDGMEGQVFDPGLPSHDAFLRESKRLSDRLEFLSSLAQLWRIGAVRALLVHADDAPVNGDAHDKTSSLQRWRQQAESNGQSLLKLLDAVKTYRLPSPTGDHDSMLEYDRVRLAKESLLERVILTAVDTADARRLLDAAVISAAGNVPSNPEEETEEVATARVFADLLRGDDDAVRARLPRLIEILSKQPLLYVPPAKAGDPRKVVNAKTRQHAIEDLLAWLPRRGFLIETCRLIETAREMERNHAVGPGAVTEFDEMFKIGYRAVVETLVASSTHWGPPNIEEADERDRPQSALVDCLEQLTEALLVSWLAHSRTLRLSVLERVQEKKAWKKLVDFIEKFGAELFTQRFLNLGNARAILHQGTALWLERMLNDPPAEVPEKLITELQNGLSTAEIADPLSIVLEAVVENYGEYRDYNSTTTQSDRGELLYMLLDFLRLRTKYDRVCWNLKPVVLAHEILVRRGCDDAARLWRRALAERINDEAEQNLSLLAKLQKQYAMRMPTVADRLNERFVRPLAIDRIRALVVPAMEEAKLSGACPQFELLDEEIEILSREPTGVGLDVPTWIVALEEEVDRAGRPDNDHTWEEELKAAVPQKLLTLEEAQSQLDAWSSR